MNKDKIYPYVEYDSNGNEIYYEHSNCHWSKFEYNKNNKLTYHENSYGYINIGNWNGGIKINIR